MHCPQRLIRLAAVALLTILATCHALAGDDFLPPEQAFRLSAEADAPDRVRVLWDIADGYYLYRHKLRFESATAGIATAEVAWPPSQAKRDDYFGEVEIYRDRLAVTVPLRREAGAPDVLSLVVTSQGCADAGLCYPPQRTQLRIALPPPATPKPEAATPAPGGGPPSAADRILGRSRGADALPPASEAFRFAAGALAPDRLLATWDIAPATFLYRDSLSISLEGAPEVALGEPLWPAPEIEADGVRPDGRVGDLAVYRGHIEVPVPIARPAGDSTPGATAASTEVTLVARYQGCADLGICYPPQTERIRVALPAMVASAAGAPTASLAATPSAPPESELDQIAAVLAGGSLWTVVALFFGLGILLSLTPCVFPMIPILSGIIAGQGPAITTRRALGLSLVYVLAMAATYTAAGVLAGLFGANLQAAFQNVWVLAAFAALFVALALSMFGLYELQLPSGLQTRLAALSHRQRGGTLTGVAIMGLLSALIVGPCVAPPLAGALIFIGQTGNALLGGIALFALSLGMGAPLIAVGTTAGKLLPRAGAWMDAVKAVFGVLLLAVAIWLLERVLAPAVAMALWALLLICSAVYMGALRRSPPEAGGWSKLWQGLGVALLIYGGLMLIGAAAGGKDTLQPLRGVVLGGGTPAAAQFERVKTLADLDRALAEARAASRPAMLDFYADWCVSCKELERYTFSDPAVIRELDRFMLLKADVTANDAADRALLQDRFGLPGPPAILFFDRTGEERRDERIIGFKPASDFLAHLRGLAL